MDKIKVDLIENMDCSKLYEEFYKELSDSTGTILIHHGKAKFPGKYVKNYKRIRLFEKSPDALKLIKEETVKIAEKYVLNKIFVFHNIGYIEKNNPILFLAVESVDRDKAFKAVREILEFIKSETLLGLEELEK
jgi:molybdopterin synthase catalytic subunit